MKLDRTTTPQGWTFLPALLAGCFLLVTIAAGCGDDDDDNDTAGAGGSEAGTGGGGGSTGGTGGSTGGTGGSTGGTGGTAQDAGAPEATAEQKTAACECYDAVGFFPDSSLKETCEENITDDCVACVEKVVGSNDCGAMTETDFGECSQYCVGLVPPPETTEECKELVRFEIDDPVVLETSDCMCEKCLELYGSCIVNPSCQSIMRCAVDTGCSGMDCLANLETGEPGPCAEVIDTADKADPTAVETVFNVNTCAEENGCRMPAADGGVPDGG